MSKLDILFIEPNSSSVYQNLADKFAAIEPPTWAMLLANSLRAIGQKVDILDANVQRMSPRQVATAVRGYDPRLVCFVVYGQNPNSGTVNMSSVEAAAEAIKQDTGTTVIVVGSHASALPREVLACKDIDIVLTNEGVYALRNLAESNLPADLPKIKGIGWKDNGTIVINAYENIVPQERMVKDLPGYAWDLIDPKAYRCHSWHNGFNHSTRSPFVAMYTSFGCKFKCQFCMINILNRMNPADDTVSSDSNVMRYWPAEFTLTQFQKLKDMGVTNVRLSDEMFFLQQDHYGPIIEGINKMGSPFNMWAYSRIDTCKKSWLENFKKAGVNWLALGIEAGNQHIRQEITKGSFKDVNIRTIVNDIHSAGIDIVGNYIYGFENETLEDLQVTLDLAKELNTAHANMYCATALPGSPLYREAKKNGTPLPTKYSQYGFYSKDYLPLPTKHLTPAQVLQFRDKAWREYYTSEKYLGMIQYKFGEGARQFLEEQNAILLERDLLNAT